MVKEADVSNLLRNYLNEKRYDCLEALYMLARGLQVSEIANALRARYGGAEGYQEVEEALKNQLISEESRENGLMLLQGLKCRIFKASL